MLTIATVTVDAEDPEALAAFWGALLDWETGPTGDGDYWVRDPSRLRDSGAPDLLFMPSEDPRAGKNRFHLDLTPDDRAAEVARALALGATPAAIGQTGEESWVVLSDPEGNEFCILSPGDWLDNQTSEAAAG